MAMTLNGQIIICCALFSLILWSLTGNSYGHALIRHILRLISHLLMLSPSWTTGGKHSSVAVVVVVVVVLPAAFSNTPSDPPTPLSSGRLWGAIWQWTLQSSVCLRVSFTLSRHFLAASGQSEEASESSAESYRAFGFSCWKGEKGEKSSQVDQKSWRKRTIWKARTINRLARGSLPFTECKY